MEIVRTQGLAVQKLAGSLTRSQMKVAEGNSGGGFFSNATGWVDNAQAKKSIYDSLALFWQTAFVPSSGPACLSALRMTITALPRDIPGMWQGGGPAQIEAVGLKSLRKTLFVRAEMLVDGLKHNHRLSDQERAEFTRLRSQLHDLREAERSGKAKVLVFSAAIVIGGAGFLLTWFLFNGLADLLGTRALYEQPIPAGIVSLGAMIAWCIAGYRRWIRHRPLSQD
jgi:hypothetical protein